MVFAVASIPAWMPCRKTTRALEAYGIHSGINKVLIINREVVPGRITVVIVDEVLGF
jgi:hypothetical protein